MAQPSGIPINPPMPPASEIQIEPPFPPSPPVHSQPQPQQELFSTAKRRREEEDPTEFGDVGESAPKRQAKGQNVIFRIVVCSRHIGKVIGKVGQRIQKIREATKATIVIADAIVRLEDRVIIIFSKDDENMVSDAENALQNSYLNPKGDVPAVLNALAEIDYQLRENPPQQVISISPAHDKPPWFMGGKGKQNVRHIKFSGSSQQVALAKQRVDECINSQMIQEAGTQQPGLQM